LSKIDFEESVSLFLEACDEWVIARLESLAAQGASLPEAETDEISEGIEEQMLSAIGSGYDAHGETFPPALLTDLHHLFFEIELQKQGIDNSDQIHQYKENGQLAITVVEGKVKPENAKLIMELNRAHSEKKGGDDEAVCEDCVCGKK
jgi:hypothetical protein